MAAQLNAAGGGDVGPKEGGRALTTADGPLPTADSLRRLRWRARRGLLENDLLITRYLDRFEPELDVAQIAGLTLLLDLSDNDLLDLLLGRTEPGGAIDTPEVRAVLERIRAL